MKGKRFYSDNHKQVILYSEQCNNHYNKGNGVIDGKDKNPFFSLYNWNYIEPEYKAENTEWNKGNGFSYTSFDLFGTGFRSGGKWEGDKQSDAIYHVKMNVWDKIKRWLNSKNI